MKLLKGIFFFVLLQTSVFLVAQEEDSETAISVTEIVIKADTIEELKTMDWDELFSVFEDNAAKDSIRVGIGVKDLTLYKKDGDRILINAMNVMVRDITENKENLKKQIQESTKNIVKVLEKMTN